MKARLMTVGAVPLFTEYGVSLTDGRWTSVDFDKLSADDLRALVLAKGRLFVVHADDEAEFANLEASLKFEDPPKPDVPSAKKK